MFSPPSWPGSAASSSLGKIFFSRGPDAWRPPEKKIFAVKKTGAASDAGPSGDDLGRCWVFAQGYTRLTGNPTVAWRERCGATGDDLGCCWVFAQRYARLTGNLAVAWR